jgi:hypothetical protein
MYLGILILQAMVSLIERWELLVIAGPLILTPVSMWQAR